MKNTNIEYECKWAAAYMAGLVLDAIEEQEREDREMDRIEKEWNEYIASDEYKNSRGQVYHVSRHVVRRRDLERYRCSESENNYKDYPPEYRVIIDRKK